MGKDIFEPFAASQFAIREYMDSKPGNEYMHDARVLVSFHGETKYNGILKVDPKIETNISFVTIIGDIQFSRDYRQRYNNVQQTFTFIHGTLLIKADDKYGNPIEIDITSV